MSIPESLVSNLYTLLTEDATLQSLMGGSVRLYHVMAPPDAEFPYLVHRLDIGRLSDFSVHARCTYLLDIWSCDPSSEEAADIRAQVLALLDNRESSTADTTAFNTWIQTEGFVPDIVEDIWHYATQFNLVFIKDSEKGALLNRV